MLRCRCRSCDTVFLDAGGATRCPSCGKKGNLQPITMRNGPPLEAQLMELEGRLPAMTDSPHAHAMVTATITRNPLRKVSSIILIVTAALALLQGVFYAILLAAVRMWDGALAMVGHIWGVVMLLGGAIALAGAIMSLQGRGMGRMLALAGAASLAGSFGLLFLPDGFVIFFVSLFLGFVLAPLMWLGAIGALILLAIPDRPIASDTTTITAVGPLSG